MYVSGTWPDWDLAAARGAAARRWQAARVLVVDEISMLSAELFDQARLARSGCGSGLV
jgi:hypothetical protein